MFSYIPQILAVARERSGAHAFIGYMVFWTVRNAATAVSAPL